VADEVAPPESGGSQSPVLPAEATGPAQPAEPVEPAEAVEPGEADEPAEPAERVEAGEPVAEAGSAEAEPSAEPATPEEPAEPAEPAVSAEPAASAEPAVSAEPAALAEPVVPAEPLAPAEPVEPESAVVESDSEPVPTAADSSAEPTAIEPVVIDEPAAMPTATVETPLRKRPAVLAGWGLLALVLVALAVSGIALAVGHHGSDQSLSAKQGDCLSGESDTDLKRVSCGDTGVKWTVIGVVQNKTQDEAKQQACAPWPQSEASYWESRNGKTGFVLCLAAVPGK
jgi:hypothetical protein